MYGWQLEGSPLRFYSNALVLFANHPSPVSSQAVFPHDRWKLPVKGMCWGWRPCFSGRISVSLQVWGCLEKTNNLLHWHKTTCDDLLVWLDNNTVWIIWFQKGFGHQQTSWGWLVQAKIIDSLQVRHQQSDNHRVNLYECLRKRPQPIS